MSHELSDRSANTHWEELEAGVWRFQDSCQVYAIEGPEGMLLIDAGTGGWLDQLADLPKPPAALVLTHHFRDHAAGAIPAARAGIPVFAPEYEADILRDPVTHLQRRAGTW